MATTTNPGVGVNSPLTGVGVPAWPKRDGATSSLSTSPSANDYPANDSDNNRAGQDHPRRENSDRGQEARQKPTQRDALQALLAFSALHDQVRRRKALAARHNGFETGVAVVEFESQEQFVLDEVLQLVAERAVAITGADGLAIALAENNEIVLRAAAGTVRPDIGARIDRDSAFSGACFRSAQIVNCDDTEVDPRVNLPACRKLGARSMVAVPLCGRRRVIGVLEAFSTWPFSFNDSDIRNLTLLAELVLGALKPEDEDRFAQSAQIAAAKLQPVPQPQAAAKMAAPLQTPAATLPSATGAPAAPPPAATAVPPAAVVTKQPDLKIASAPATAIPLQPAVGKTEVSKTEVHKAEVNKTEVNGAEVNKTEVRKETRKIESESAPDAAFIAATTAELELILGQLQPARATEPDLQPLDTERAVAPRTGVRRPGVLVLLISVVVAVAFVAGLWWKWSNAQLGSMIVHTEKTTIKPASPAANATVAAPATQAAGNPAGAEVSTDSIIDANEASYSPASTQDLAKFPRVTGIRHWSSADSSTVVLDLEDQVQYEAHRLTGPDRIYFDLRDTRLAAELAGKTIDIGDALLNRVRVAQPVAGMTRVVLETKADTNFSVSLEPNPYRLVVEVRKVGVNSKAAVNLFPNNGGESSRAAIVVPPPTKEDLQLRARVPKMRIVVDAGHGGWDLGTVGKRGLLEKDLVLEVAERLGKLLESRLGTEVIFTRQDDTYIPLDERASIANQAQADLFVSVHANYSDLPSARGVETYYTNSFSTPGSKEVGSDVDPHPSAGKTVTPTLSAADLHERIEQSRRLAASVQRSLYGTLSAANPGLRDRGVREAAFVVLTESAMPGILAEVSFVSSPTDEQKLRSDGYREEIAEALYRGIARYAASSKGGKVAAK